MCVEKLNKPNELISLISEKPLTLIQRKLYNIFLKNTQNIVKFSNLKEYEEIDTDKLYKFSIPCAESHQGANVKIKDYLYAKQQLEKLMAVTVSVIDRNNPNNWDSFSILPKIRKIDDEYEYFLIGNIVKALKIQNYFTSLNLLIMNTLGGQYSIILYELAIQYKKKQIPRMSIEELRKITGTENVYKKFPNFRARVLDPAIEEVTEKTDIKLSYELKKIGNAYKYIDFKITPKRKKSIEQYTEEYKEYNENVLKLFELLPSEEKSEKNKKELAKLIKEHSFKMLKEDIIYCKNQNYNKFMPYFINSCENGHYSTDELEKNKLKEEQKAKRLQVEKEEMDIIKEEEEEINKRIEEEYKELTELEKEEYSKKYNLLPNRTKKFLTLENYIKGQLELEIK